MSSGGGGAGRAGRIDAAHNAQGVTRNTSARRNDRASLREISNFRRQAAGQSGARVPLHKGDFVKGAGTRGIVTGHGSIGNKRHSIHGVFIRDANGGRGFLPHDQARLVAANLNAPTRTPVRRKH